MPRALIGVELVCRLPKKHQDFRDTRIAGFVVRCRPSGVHSYRMQIGRGQWVTLGRVDKMVVAEARAAAEAMRSDLSKTALVKQADDPALTLAEARAEARAQIRRRRSTRHVRTFGAFVIELYTPWAREHLRRPDEALERLKAHFSGFEDLPLSSLQGFQIERWRTERRKAGAKPSTINRDLVALRSALSRAVEARLLREHPMRDIKAIAIDKRPHVRYLTLAEEKRLRAALEARDDRRRASREQANEWRRARGYAELPPYGTYTDHLTPIVLLALNTGLRRGELLGLRWADVDRVARVLNVQGDGTKSGDSRAVPLNREALGVLNTWQGQYQKPAGSDPVPEKESGLVFPGDDGEQMGSLKTAFTAILKDAKISGFRFHDLRHSFASKLVMSAVDLNTVRELLGHADLKMTLRYAHLAPEHKAAAVAKLDVGRLGL